MLPFISSKVWQYVFYSRFCKVVASKADIYFTVFIIVLIFFFLDSVREMLMYSNKTPVDLGQELQIHLKLFRSQRNYYISGFTVFLWLVIRRLVTLILCEAELLSENESAMKRAQNATETVEKILKKKEIENEKCIIAQTSVMQAEELRRAVDEVKRDLNFTKKTMEDVKQKSEQITKEYDVLLEKHTELLKTEEDENQKLEQDQMASVKNELSNGEEEEEEEEIR